MRALFAGLKGWSTTAPAHAIRWFERAQFVHDHPAYRYSDYDDADAGDILLDKDFHNMLAGMK